MTRRSILTGATASLMLRADRVSTHQRNYSFYRRRPPDGRLCVGTRMAEGAVSAWRQQLRAGIALHATAEAFAKFNQKELADLVTFQVEKGELLSAERLFLHR